MIQASLTTERLMSYIEFNSLLGQTLTSIQNINDERLIFTNDKGQVFEMSHQQDCCESVTIESITGDLLDLIGSPILMAEENFSHETPECFTHEYEPESQTWTFYKLSTIKGYVDIRWFGESNGYYSESVSFWEVKQ
jgi:hypothetical protein